MPSVYKRVLVSHIADSQQIWLVSSRCDKNADVLEHGVTL
jgi:hypothetical protein